MCYYKLHYIAGSVFTLLITLLLGSLIYFRGRRGEVVRSYYLLMLSIAEFSLCTLLFCLFNDKDYTLFFARASYIGVSFVPIFYFHFIIKLMGLTEKIKRVLSAGYILAVIFSGLSFSPLIVKSISFKLGLNFNDPGVLHPVFMLFFAGFPAYAHYLMGRSIGRLSDIGKRQMKYVTIAGICGLSGGSLMFFTVYGVSIPIIGPMALYFVALANLFVAIATYVVRLMGVEVIRRRTLIFSILYGASVGSFVAFVFILQRHLSASFNVNRWILPVAAVFILTVFIRPLEKFLAGFTDAFLYQRGYDYMLVLRNVAKGMTLITDTRKLLNLMVRFISKEVRITGSSAYIFNKTLNSYIREVRRGFKGQQTLERVDADNPLVKWLMEKREPISYESVLSWIQGDRIFPQRIILKKTLDHIRVTMEKTGAVLCVPSFLRGQMIGFIVLGPKLSGNIYTSDDFSLLSTLANNAAIAFENARMYEELTERIYKLDALYKEEHALFLDAASAFSFAIDSKDGYTYAHTRRLSNYAMATAKELEKLLPYINFNDSFYETLHIASLLHDVGKIGIPDRILKKRSALTDEEKEKFKEHVTIGQNILKPIKEIGDSFDVIRHHHENFDGTGYPDGLKGNAIPMASRIIAVCNGFDIMTSTYLEGEPVTRQQAIEKLKEKSGSFFDPVIVDAFIAAYANKEYAGFFLDIPTDSVKNRTF
ncbi:MAG: HD domain-containing protein [Candidatus Omnitrophica bacterium]|nr:HD domain-containing protein [Candidatus Omnitrophota bacterium]